MKVINIIKVLEINDNEVKPGENKVLEVCSHWKFEHLVVLKFENWSCAVCALELQKAINNATDN